MQRNQATNYSPKNWWLVWIKRFFPMAERLVTCQGKKMPAW